MCHTSQTHRSVDKAPIGVFRQNNMLFFSNIHEITGNFLCFSHKICSSNGNVVCFHMLHFRHASK